MARRTAQKRVALLCACLARTTGWRRAGREPPTLRELTIRNRAGYTEGLGTGPILEDVLTRRWDLRRSWFLTMPQTGWRGSYAQALRRAIDRHARANPLLDSAGPLPDGAVRQMHALMRDGQN